jgi:hypothetical protein
VCDYIYILREEVYGLDSVEKRLIAYNHDTCLPTKQRLDSDLFVVQCCSYQWLVPKRCHSIKLASFHNICNSDRRRTAERSQ